MASPQAPALPSPLLSPPLVTMSSSARPTDAPPLEVEECRGVLRVFSDGTVVRATHPSFNTPVHDDGSVAWKDVVFDPVHALSLRLYKPAGRLDGDPTRYPIFYYYHGGGFCIGSRTWPNCQNYCLRLASDLRAIVVAPDYRLAPEHRLPAAIEDGVSAIEWLRREAAAGAEADPWLADSADFGRVFVSGDSAGGNIAHHLAVRYGSDGSDASPVEIRGYALLMPFFSGSQYTRSEADCPKDAFLNLELNDRYWRLSLPPGEGRDHPVCNPFGPDSPALDRVDFRPVLVVVGGKDLLTDRSKDYARRLRELGKPVEVVEFEQQQHGFFTLNPRSEPADKLMRIIKRFVDRDGAFD